MNTSPDLNVASSYLALPRGQYQAKRKPLGVDVGTLVVTEQGKSTIHLPFKLLNTEHVRPIYAVESNVGHMVKASFPFGLQTVN